MTNRLLAFLLVGLVWLAMPAAAQVTDLLTPDTGQDAPAEEDPPADPADGASVEELQAEAAAEPDVFEDMDEWRALADRAEMALEAGRASNRTLDDLRAEIATWRDRFLSRMSTNGDRIATVQAQIDALGEPSESEDVRVTARRAELEARLNRLRAPAILAREAHARANGLIGEIDAIIRNRGADQLTQRVQSPLNPIGWGEAVDAILTGVRATRAEVTTALSNSQKRQNAIDSLPAALLFLVGGVLLLLRARMWIGWLEGTVNARSRRGRGVWRFTISLGEIVLQFLGLVFLSNAIEITGLVGTRGQKLVDALPIAGLFPILAHWVGRLLLFPADEGREAPLPLPEDGAPRAFRLMLWIGYIFAAAILAVTFMEATGFGEDASAVVVFVIGSLLAWTLYRLGHVLRRTFDSTEDEATSRGFRQTARALLSRGLIAAAVLGVAAGALGYVAVFQMFLFPASLTLYLLGLLIVLQRLSVDIYTLLSGIEDGAQDALIPVLIGFLLVLVAMPVLALIWGARATDLTELWARFQEGFSIGATRISPTDFLTFALVFIVGYTVTRLLQGALRSSVLPRTKLDAGGQNAVVAGIGYVGIFLAAVIAITTAGIDLSGLAIVAGALSVGIGFGLQNIVSNFVSGIILLIERPISQGDWIEVGGQMGYVRDISVRSTRIETFDRTDVIVPNADLVSNQVTNWTRGNNVGRVIVPVGVAYGTDTDRVATILREIAEAHPMVLMNPPPNVVFQGFGADSLDFEIRAILRDVNWVLSVKSDMNHAIAKRFAEEEIEIPFAQRDIWLRNPEVLRDRMEEVAEAPEVQPEPPQDEDGDAQ